MGRHMVSLRVSGTLIARELHMPEGTEIYNIVRHDYAPDIFEFYVEHPDLPECDEGARPFEVTPTITRNEDGSFTWDWNLPDGRNEG